MSKIRPKHFVKCTWIFCFTLRKIITSIVSSIVTNASQIFILVFSNLFFTFLLYMYFVILSTFLPHLPVHLQISNMSKIVPFPRNMRYCVPLFVFYCLTKLIYFISISFCLLLSAMILYIWDIFFQWVLCSIFYYMPLRYNSSYKMICI